MKIEEKDKVILEFPVLWPHWEMDSLGWVMEKEDGSRYIKLTNHCSPYIAKNDELLKRIDFYKNVLTKTEKALSLIEE